MSNHPSKEELSGFLLGKLAAEASDAVADHIGECPPCQSTLHDLEAHNDTLLKGLQQPASPSIDAVGQEALRKIGETPPGSVPASVAPHEVAQTSLTTAAQGAAQAREKFVASLLASGVMDADDWSQLQKTNAAVAQAVDGQALARALVQCGTLSKYQASAIYQGRIKGLVYGEYAVVDLLGEGGMGQVFKARHRSMDRIVALKVLTKGAVNSPEAVKRFQREVKAAAKLVHPNIVTAFDAGKHDGVHFLVMEFVPGSDLSALVKKQGPLPPAQATLYTLQAARGLAFAHSKGVVHRDIKPANLLVDSEGVVKILDMGLARLDVDIADAGAGDGLTQTGQIMGTVDYMAPEQAFDTSKADVKADMYSLGCTLYRLLTGANVFAGDSLMQKLLAHREQPIPSLRSVRSDVSPALDAIYQRMVAKQPQDRPTMTELIAELEALDRGELTTSFVPTTIAKDSKSDSLFAIQAIATSPKVGPKTLVGNQTIAWKAASRGKKPPTKRLLIGAAAAGAAALLVWGVIVRFKDKDGNLIAEATVPGATSATVVVTPDTVAPTVTAAAPIPPSFTSPAGLGPRLPQADSTFSLKTIPAEALTFAGHRYLLVRTNDVMTWDDAKVRAETMGGHLATITTQAEYDWVRDNIYNKQRLGIRSPSSARVYMGAVKTVADSEPKWITGEASGFRPWSEARYKRPEDLAVVWNLAGLTPYALRNIPDAGSFLVEWDTLGPSIGTSQEAAPPLAKAPFDAAQAKAHQEAWAKHLGIEIETTNCVGQKMVLIPPGEFLMGSTDEQVAAALKVAAENKADATAMSRIQMAERPQHKVVITKPLLMSATEVTIDQFKKFVEVSKYATEAEQYGFGESSGTVMDDKVKDVQKQKNWRTPGYPVTNDSPVAQITWNDAAAYCRWLSSQEKRTYRLPSEAEWEYACRAGTTTQFSFGDDSNKSSQYGWFRENAGAMARPVGAKLPNGFGLFDMHGNLYEWCGDFFDETWYEKSLTSDTPSIDPTGPSVGSWRVIRGGHWSNVAAYSRSAYRFRDPPTNRTDYIGFRCVQELDVIVTTAGIPTASAGSAATSAKLFMHDPTFPQWLKDVQTLPTERQIEAVSKKLVELNPGFDGAMGADAGSSAVKGNPKVENGVVTQVALVSSQLLDLSPLRALAGLEKLTCHVPQGPANGILRDLSPLTGMQLTSLSIRGQKFLSDLTPLKSMPLNDLDCSGCKSVSDLTPLHDMALTTLNLRETPIVDLSPLTGINLKKLDLFDCRQLFDLSPLKEMKLECFVISSSGAMKVSDLSVLAVMPLKDIQLNYIPERDKELLRSIKTLERINFKPSAEFLENN